MQGRRLRAVWRARDHIGLGSPRNNPIAEVGGNHVIRRWTTPNLFAQANPLDGRIFVYCRWRPLMLIGRLFSEDLPKVLPVSLYAEWDELAETVADEILSKRARRKGK
jgi:hypothetical protein